MMRLATSVVLWLCVAHTTTLVAGSHASCYDVEGWAKILQLYSGHYDVTNLVSFQSQPSEKLLNAVLCGMPLSLNTYGVPLASLPDKCSGKWMNEDRTCRESGKYRDDDTTVTAFERFAFARKTHVHFEPNVPDVSSVTWLKNQHVSPTIRPADTVVYNTVGMKDPQPFLDHVAVQLEETAHAILLYGDVCAKESPMRKAVFSLVESGVNVETLYCHENDTVADTGLVVMRRGGLVLKGPLVTYESLLAAPAMVKEGDLFIANTAKAGVIYRVPKTCVFRLATSPLQHVFYDNQGDLISEPHSGIPHQYLHQSTFQSVKIRQAPSFRHTFYSGPYCGVTVMTTAFATQGQMLFYTIATPVVEAMAEMGMPTFMRYDSTGHRPRVPVLHTYFHYELPGMKVRERRYLAYQLEYAPGKIRNNNCRRYMSGAVVPLEYTENQLDHWRVTYNITNTWQLPLCYHPSIEYRLPPAPTPVSDGLFPGIIRGKPRREEILKDMADNGVTVRHRSYLFRDPKHSNAPRYGVEDIIDGLLSQVVLNFHAYSESAEGQLEVPRLTPYLSNGMFVISEQGTEPAQKAILEDALVFVPDGEPRLTASLVKQYLGDENAGKRAKVAAKAVDIMKNKWACKKNEDFLGAIDRIAGVAFPSWYVESFYSRASHAAMFSSPTSEPLSTPVP